MAKIVSKVPALVRSLLILDYIRLHQHCTISELVDNLELPRSSIYVLVDELISSDLIRQNSDGTLQLWMRLISLGRAAAEQLNLKDLVLPELEWLLSEVDCLAVHYGVMEGMKAFYALKLVSPRASMQIMSREGMEVSLLHAGLGKCLLAFQSICIQEQIINGLDYTKVTPTSLSSPEELRAELHKIREQRWAFDNSEGEAEIRCVAVPVFGPEQQLLGAVSLVGTVSRFKLEEIPILVKATQECVTRIETKFSK